MKSIIFCLAMAGALFLQITSADAQSIVVERSNPSEEQEILEKYQSPDKQFRFAIDGGFSYRTAKMADNIPHEFAKQMRSGVNFGAELAYFPSHAWGFGAKYSGRLFNAEMGNVSDNVHMHYFAPMVVGRVFDRKNRNAWVFGLSIGYLSFKENTKVDHLFNSILEGGVGATAEIGYDIRISKSIFLGFKLSATSGTVTADIAGETLKENCSSLDITVGLRF